VADIIVMKKDVFKPYLKAIIIVGMIKVNLNRYWNSYFRNLKTRIKYKILIKSSKIQI